MATTLKMMAAECIRIRNWSYAALCRLQIRKILDFDKNHRQCKSSRKYLFLLIQFNFHKQSVFANVHSGITLIYSRVSQAIKKARKQWSVNITDKKYNMICIYLKYNIFFIDLKKFPSKYD